MIFHSEDMAQDTMSAKEYQERYGRKVPVKKKTVPKAEFNGSESHFEVINRYGFQPENSFYIRGHVYSSKNSKRIFPKPISKDRADWTYKGRPVVPFITDSSSVEAYRKATGHVYKALAPVFRQRTSGLRQPLVVQFTFIRMDNQAFDFPNICQLVMDMMVHYGWIDDDNISKILPVPPLPPFQSHFVSKQDAGVIITVSYDGE